eukprot:m51a1_g12335 putative pumilio-family rna binding protein (1123) ;mRNA; f:491671-495824
MECEARQHARGAPVVVGTLLAALLATLGLLVCAVCSNSWCIISEFLFITLGLREVPMKQMAVSLAFLQAVALAGLLVAHLTRAEPLPARGQSLCTAVGAFSVVSSVMVMCPDIAQGTATRFAVHFAPALHLLALAMATWAAFLIAPVVVSRLRCASGAVSGSSRLCLACLVYSGVLVMAAMLLLPLVIERTSTGIIRGQMPRKPRLIAHRGLSRAAPENSLEGIEVASEAGMYGVEFDVAVTRDGVPVLLHDRTFRRTTDIDSVFPGRARDDPSHFTSQELSRLTLSRWCNRQCDGPLDEEIERTFNEARVPTMAQALESAQRQRLHAIWDLRKPSNEHAGDWMDIILNVTMASTAVDRSLVWWLSDGMSERARSAGFKRACPVKPGHWERAEGRQCDVLNMHHAVSVEELQRAKKSGAWVNVYVVDTEWLFSQLWVLGVDSVTTTNPFVMARMHKPAYTLDLWTYRSLWALADLVTLLVVTGRLLVVLGDEEQRLRALFGPPVIAPPSAWTPATAPPQPQQPRTILPPTVTSKAPGPPASLGLAPGGPLPSAERVAELEKRLREKDDELRELKRLVVRLQDVVLEERPMHEAAPRLEQVMGGSAAARSLDVSALSSFSTTPSRTLLASESSDSDLFTSGPPSPSEPFGEPFLPSSLLSAPVPQAPLGAVSLPPVIAAQRVPPSVPVGPQVSPIQRPGMAQQPSMLSSPPPSRRATTAVPSLLPTPPPTSPGTPLPAAPLQPTAAPFIRKIKSPLVSPLMGPAGIPVVTLPVAAGVPAMPAMPPAVAAGMTRSRGDSDASEGSMGPTSPAALEEMKGQMYQLTKYQAGCRFLQRQLDDHGTPENVQLVFEEVYEHLPDMMVDPYGQYLVPKLMQHGTPPQRQAIVDKLLPDIVKYACNQYGSHGSQKMLVFLSPGQVQQVSEAIKPRMMELCKDVKGNYFVQAFLKLFPPDRTEFIYDFICENLMEVSGHKVGCTVVSKAVDCAPPAQLERLAQEVISRALVLMQDQYANYVVQHMITHTDLAPRIIRAAIGHIAFLSTQKFSSNCLEVAEEDLYAAMLREIMADKSLPVLLDDQFGNFVIQTALDTAGPEMHAQLVQKILPHIHEAHSPYAMHIQKKLLRV